MPGQRKQGGRTQTIGKQSRQIRGLAGDDCTIEWPDAKTRPGPTEIMPVRLWPVHKFIFARVNYFQRP